MWIVPFHRGAVVNHDIIGSICQQVPWCIRTMGISYQSCLDQTRMNLDCMSVSELSFETRFKHISCKFSAMFTICMGGWGVGGNESHTPGQGKRKQHPPLPLGSFIMCHHLFFVSFISLRPLRLHSLSASLSSLHQKHSIFAPLLFWCLGHIPHSPHRCYGTRAFHSGQCA